MTGETLANQTPRESAPPSNAIMYIEINGAPYKIELTYLHDGLLTEIADESVTNAKLAHVATDIIKGRTTAGTGDVEDLSVSDVVTMLKAVQSDTTGITGSDQMTNMVSLTQAEYDALGTKNASTLYVISG